MPRKDELKKLKYLKLVKITWLDACEYLYGTPYRMNRLDVQNTVGWIISQDKKAVTLINNLCTDGTYETQSIFIIPKTSIQKVRLL